MIRRTGGPAPRVPYEIVTDPVRIEECRLRHEQAVRNMDWLGSHWGDLLPAAIGKYVAVAGQEAFIGDDPCETCTRAMATHPKDMGVLLQYVSAHKGPRCYASRREVAG